MASAEHRRLRAVIRLFPGIPSCPIFRQGCTPKRPSISTILETMSNSVIAAYCLQRQHGGPNAKDHALNGIGNSRDLVHRTALELKGPGYSCPETSQPLRHNQIDSTAPPLTGLDGEQQGLEKPPPDDGPSPFCFGPSVAFGSREEGKGRVGWLELL